MNAVDTNILLYSIDRHEPAKQAKAQQLLQRLRSASEPTLLLWQVLGESVQQLRRWRDQGKLTDAEFLRHVQTFRHLFPLVLRSPERPAGRMVLDEVADGPRRYARGDGSGDERRVEWLKKVAPAKDPRVVIALAELVFDGETIPVRDEAAIVLWKHQVRRAGSTAAMPCGAAELNALRPIGFR